MDRPNIDERASSLMTSPTASPPSEQLPPRSNPFRLSGRIPTLVALDLAIILLALRFVDLEHGPFLQDEPLLQLQVDNAIRTGKLPLHAGINAQDVRYSPFPL